MTLYEQWVSKSAPEDQNAFNAFWDEYSIVEQKTYAHILKNKLINITGTVRELSEKLEMEPTYICGFLDGISEATLLPMDEEALNALTEDSFIDITIDFTKLYKKMVEYKADYLYSLAEWDDIFDKEVQKQLYKEQRISTTYVNDEKIGRNDPCPCGSGKKYKKCCENK